MMDNSICQRVFCYAQTQPDKLCVADINKSLTYGQYSELVRRMAQVLCEKGVNAGDTVVVEASQTADYLALGLAIECIGAIFVPVERSCAGSKIASLAQTCHARIVVTAAQGEYPCNQLTLGEIVQGVQSAVPYDGDCVQQPQDVCEILFSTGTTGKEKGIVMTNDSDIALAQNVIDAVKMEKDNVELIPSPLNHSHGLRRYYANMYNGSTVIIATSVMNLAEMFELMDKYHVNAIDMVPSALSILLKLSRGMLGNYKDKLRYIQFGAAPLMQNDKDEIKRLLPNTRMYNFYGSTESGCIVAYNFNDGRDKKNCIGKPVINAHVIITQDRQEIKSSADNTGLLASGGRMNMMCYYNDEEETAAAMYNGYVYTNDEAYYDEDGDIILLGRKGFVMNIGGNKVSPEEIESIAKKHPMVEDCCCVPTKDKLRGQAVKIYVQLAKGYSFDKTELNSFIASQTEPYKVPKIYETIEEIPRTYNGKIIRRLLIEREG